MKRMLPRPKLIPFLLLALAVASPSFAELTQELERRDLTPPPVNLEGAYSGRADGQFLLAGGQLEGGELNPHVYVLPEASGEWSQAGQLETPRAFGGSATHGSDLFVVGGRVNGEASARVSRVNVSNGQATVTALPDLPQPLYRAAAEVFQGRLYVAGGSADLNPETATNAFYVLDLANPAATWESLPSWDGPGRHSAFLIGSIESLYVIAGVTEDGSEPAILSYHPLYGWDEMGPTPPLHPGATVAKVGEAHVLVLTAANAEDGNAFLYHTVGDTWLPVDEYLGQIPLGAEVAGSDGLLTMVAPNSAVEFEFGDPMTNYGWWDHLAVAAYFGIMIYVGFHFTKQESSTQNYFRGGNRIPWWATGMSLFATGASALSLLAMPGKSYSTNWTFFMISVYSVICLPLSMYLLAPLVRKLNFGTAFEYLEHRFGLSVRMFGSAIFVLQQVLGRMGPVMLLPSIAMAAITGVDIKTCIIAMGVVTTLYTFLGGLSAVIWTDTIQGLVMVCAVFGCLVLVYFRLDIPPDQMWTVLDARDKLHMLDFDWSLTGNTALMMFLGVVAITLFGISDQNYVQRVQCTPSLSDAKKAIATQMAVAVPINILLFALGTALFLFYRQQPEDLNPVMQNDGIFPFFAAQQLPPGVSGLVVAALLAATMSTISSSICSVSNLGVDDFYKRFFRQSTDAKAVVVGRVLTVVVGGLGIGAALFLSEFQTPSVWDLALEVISFITSATLGMFGLGLLTRKSNEIGVIVGIIAGILSTYFIQTYTNISYWIYPVTGSIVTVAVGYAVSLATGGNRKDIDGLTVYTLQNRKGGLDG